MVFVDSSGWIAAFTIIGTNKAVGAIMIVVAILFTICAGMSIILLKMVRVYSLFFIFSVLICELVSGLINLCFYLCVFSLFVLKYKFGIVFSFKSQKDFVIGRLFLVTDTS